MIELNLLEYLLSKKLNSFSKKIKSKIQKKYLLPKKAIDLGQIYINLEKQEQQIEKFISFLSDSKEGKIKLGAPYSLRQKMRMLYELLTYVNAIILKGQSPGSLTNTTLSNFVEIEYLFCENKSKYQQIINAANKLNIPVISFIGSKDIDSGIDYPIVLSDISPEILEGLFLEILTNLKNKYDKSL